MKPAAPDRTPSRLRVPRAQRQQQMLEAAEAVFASRGYRATSMDEIAAQVGVTKPMIYEYFGSKDGLLRACLARARQQLLELTVRAVGSGGEPREVMHRALLAFFRFVDDHAAAWAVLQSESLVSNGPGAAEIEQIRRQQSGYTQALLAGMAWARDLDEQQLQVRAEMVTGACERVAVWRTASAEPVSAATAAQLVLDVLWPGLSSSA